MKLHLCVLKRFIDLPELDERGLRDLLDDLGLEVKGMEAAAGQTVFNIETLANRGDHLHALGIARELSARLLSPVRIPPVVSELSDKKVPVPVKNNTEKCFRYALMAMSLPENMALGPEISELMRDSTGRHPIVHYLNYLLLEIGQPMHAFDREKIEGEIRVELSDVEEEIVALDNRTYRVPEGSIMIRDRKKTVAVGGVIGCANSMVTEGTKDVLIESASFDPVSVRLTARSMGLSTDASYLFERGCDREAVMFSLKRLAYLTRGSKGSVKGDSGAHVVGLTYEAGSKLEERKITLDIDVIRREMNLPRLKPVEIKSRLQYLGYRVEDGEDNLFEITVPSWRLWDVENDMDIVEDFVRSHGFNRVKLDIPPLSSESVTLTPAEEALEKIEPVLLGNGFVEVINDAFYSGSEVEILTDLNPNLKEAHVSIVNAEESSCSNLKITNVIHMSRLCADNLKRGVRSVKAYELGRVFGVKPPNLAEKPSDDGFLYERDVLSLICGGRWWDNDYKKPADIKESLLYLKGILEAVSASIGAGISVSGSSEAIFHPGRQCRIVAEGMPIGFLGAVNPQLLKKLGIDSEIIYAELDFRALIQAGGRKKFSWPSEYPSIKKDLTLKIPVQTFAGEAAEIISDMKLSDLVSVEIVDDFKKEGEDFRRVSYRLTFQSSQKTLEHSKVDEAVEGLITALKEDHKLNLAG